MTTEEIEYALIKNLNLRQHYVIRNLSWGIHNLHECDMVKLTKSGYATEYEIKTNKADIIRDKYKQHQHQSDYIKELYFVVPYNLIDYAFNNIPVEAGLIAVYDMPNLDLDIQSFNTINFQLRFVRAAKKRKNAKKWSHEDIVQLLRLSNMRILKYAREMAKIKWEKRNGQATTLF